MSAIGCIVAAAVAVLVGAGARAAGEDAGKAPPETEVLRTLRQGHPRLLADAARFAQLRQAVASDPYLKPRYEALRAAGERMLGEPPSEYVIPDGLRLLATSRRVLDRVQALAFLYRMDGDRRWAERAWAELHAAAAFKDWNPRHFLDTAEMTHAFAIGYDWLHDFWTPEQRAELRAAIVEKGLKQALGTRRGHMWWSRANHNWNQVCNGGLGMGALAVADEEPEVAAQILHDALASLPRAVSEYGPDGAWAEGPGYWHYATMYTVAFMAGLQSALGTDFGLSAIPGFSQCGLFLIHTIGPSGRSFNYADAHEGTVRSAEMWWLARRFRVPGYGWYAKTHSPGNVLEILWYDPSIPTVRPRGLPLAFRFRKAEVAAMRTAWGDRNAVWVGLKAGDNKANHSHLDLGSFVLEAGGVRWAVDPGSDDYNLPGYFGLQRFSYYRLRAEAHNTLVYGPGAAPDQDARAVCSIVDFGRKGDAWTAGVDLAPAYAGKVEAAHRQVTLRDDGRVTVRDTMRAAVPVDAWWFMHTGVDIALSANGREAVLTQGGRRLRVTIAAPAGAAIAVMDAAPLPTSPNPPMQSRNAGLRKLAIHFPATASLDLTVEMALEPSSARAPGRTPGAPR